jgi:glutamine amidotransferase
MSDVLARPRVAIVDYGMGNLFSVKHACEHVGLDATITESREALRRADAVVLPGIGAFPGAMETLRRLDLVGPLQDAAVSGTPMLAVCLGMQLLMSGSHEFGWHAGLGVVPGEVRPLRQALGDAPLKVPHIGWSAIHPAGADALAREPMLKGLPDGALMYFVHSFYVAPERPELAVTMTRYGAVDFCSSVRSGAVFACQFHPERSGPAGLSIYANLAAALGVPTQERGHAREARSEVRTA